MHIAFYLMKNKILAKDFAAKLGINKIYFQNIINGRFVPGRSLIKVIETETKGLVTEKDFLNTEHEYFNIYGKRKVEDIQVKKAKKVKDFDKL